MMLTTIEVEMLGIRRARAADAAQVLALLAAEELPAEGVEDGLEGFLVAEEDGRVVGVIGIEVHGECGLLRSAAVDPAWRSRGVGAALTRAALSEARERGVPALYLLTTSAAAYFARHGFAAVPRGAAPEEIAGSEEFTRLCPASAVLMRIET
jgi:amino-acid N-acetyltransferase